MLSSKKFKKNIRVIKILVICIAIGFFANSCIIVKELGFEKKSDEAEIKLSPKPEIEMSDLLVRSEQGDMISFIPKDWFFVDLEQDASPEIFSVAVNPDYTLAAVFSEIRKNDQLNTAFETDGLIGVARTNYERKNKKSGGLAQLYTQYKSLEAGSLQFAYYETTTTGGALATRVVVFKTELDFFYELALIPMDIIGKPMPPKNELDKIFNSFVATIKY